MADAKNDVKMTSEERSIVLKAMKGHVQSLLRAKTKEGESEIGEVLSKQIAQARNVEMKIMTKELF